MRVVVGVRGLANARSISKGKLMHGRFTGQGPAVIGFGTDSEMHARAYVLPYLPPL
jgi:hypothetical protein